jgi:hypothetical protein
MAIDRKLDINHDSHVKNQDNPEHGQSTQQQKPIRGKMLNNVD